MDTEKCRALLTALEVGNLAGAACKMGYTPSGMSRMMASLEAEVGFPLLVRSKQGVVPTEACRSLLPYLHELTAAEQSLKQAAARVLGLEVGTVRMGCVYRQFYEVLAQIIAEFGALYPGVQVNLVQDNSTPLMRRLDARELDLCLVTHRAGQREWHTLLEDEMVMLVSPEHPLSKAKAYPLKRLEKDPYVDLFPGQESDHSLVIAQAGIVANTRFTANDMRAAYELVAAGLGVTLVNALTANEQKGHLVALPLRPRVSLKIGVATQDDVAPSPAVSAFLDFALPRLHRFSRTLAADEV